MKLQKVKGKLLSVLFNITGEWCYDLRKFHQQQLGQNVGGPVQQAAHNKQQVAQVRLEKAAAATAVEVPA